MNRQQGTTFPFSRHSRARLLCLAIVLSAIVLSVASTAGTSAQPTGRDAVVLLPQAHAHNDYQHARPLKDALEHGFCSVEADVFPVRDQLLVGHSVLELRRARTLTDLYLKPLAS